MYVCMYGMCMCTSVYLYKLCVCVQEYNEMSIMALIY